jgi:hypothetical protein
MFFSDNAENKGNHPSGTPMREGIVGWGANRVWEVVCAMLCQCLHDAMGGHKMSMLGDTYRVGERRSRERCAKVRGFAALSTRTEPTEWILFFIIIYVDFAFVK